MSNTTPPPEPKPGNAWYKIGKEEKVDPNDKRSSFERFIDNAAKEAAKVLPAAMGYISQAGTNTTVRKVQEEKLAYDVQQNPEKYQGMSDIEKLGVFTGEGLAKPYRQYVARPLSTAFLSANKNYQKQGGAGFFDTDTWARGWKDAQHVSPGQAIVGFVGADLVSGTQGTDKIDWTDAEEVHAYFDHGPQRWISFSADLATSWFLDPLVVGGKVAGKTVRKYGNVPVTSKNLPDIVKGIDDATTGGVTNEWTSTFDFYKRNINNEAALLAHPTIAGKVDLMRTINAAAEKAMETGNDAFLGEAVKVAVGDPAAVDKAIYNSTYLASDLGVLTGERALINESIGIIRGKETELLNGFWTHNSPLATRLIKDYKNQRAVIETRMSETQSELDIIDRIADQPIGSIQRVTVSKFERINQRRAAKAEAFASSYWHTEDVGNGARVLHYLEPNSMLHENPSNFAALGAVAGERSHIEFAARVRQWAKLTGKSGKVAKRYWEIYLRNQNKTDQWDMLESFNEKAMRDIVIKRLKETGTITRAEQDLVVQLADVIAKNSRMHKSRVLEHIVDNNYTIHDGSGSHIFIKQMKDYENAAAKEIAESRAGKGATPTEKDLADAKKVVKDSLSNIQTGSSQVPNLHYSTDLKQFDNLIAEHASELRALIEESKRAVNQGINPEQLWNEISGTKSSDLLVSEAIQQSAKDITKRGFDTSVLALDNLYNQIWKPITLASFHYTSRNVFEGWQRILGSSLELSRDTGMSHLGIIRGAYSKGILKRTFKNRAITYDAKKAQKVLNRARVEIVDKEYKYNSELADSLYATSDSFMASISESALEIDAMLDKYNRYLSPDGSPRKIKALSGYPQEVLDHMETYLERIADTTTIPGAANKELYTSIANLDHTSAFEIIASADSKLTLDTLGVFQKRIRSEIDYLDEVITSDKYASFPAEMKAALANTKANLNNADVHIGGITTLALAKASARGELESLIAKTDILGNIEKSGTGEFEVYPGLMAPDWSAGVIGAIMRKETDAVMNSTRTVFNLDRATTQNMLNGRVRTGIVSPFITKSNGVKVNNPGWAEVAADHANRRVRDASIQKIMQSSKGSTETLAEVTKWAKSNTKDAKSWRELMRISIGQLKEQGLSDPISHLIQRNMLFVEGHLPETGIDGQVISPMLDDAGKFVLDKDGNYVPGLRKKALDGELTAEDMLSIPERQRTSTTGDILEESNLGKWKTITSFLLKNLGSKPETFLARHPFYSMMYRAEYRRIAELWKKQGRSDDYINANLEKLQDSSHKFAYKSLMEKMYSIERRTEPAEFMRFLSPFYMAKQNSNRFWFGYALRNPQAAVRYFQLYSSPTRVFDVEDESGKDVTYVNPFSSAGASIYITLPGSLAKALGIPEDNRLRSQISSWDLINNGTIPFAPELGGPVFTRGAGWLLNKASGTPYDPENALINLGINPQLFQKSILPFYQKQQQDSPRDAILNAIVDVNSWMSSALKAAGGSKVPLARGIGELIEPGSKEAFNSRLIKNYIVLHEEWLAEQDPNTVMSERQQSKAIAEILAKATGITSHEFILESFLSAGPTVGNIKIEDQAIRMSKELRQYQKQWGQDLGKTKYVEFLITGEKSSEEAYRTAFIAQYQPRPQNQYGVISTPQTVKNIVSNRELFDTLSRISQGKDNLADNKLLGALFNAGDPVKHYTQVASNKLFTEGIKVVYNDPKAVATNAAIESGNAQYFAVVDYYNSLAAAQNPPIKPGSDEYKEIYKPKIDEAKVIIGNKNPMWKSSYTMSPGTSGKNMEIIDTVINDKKFMSTVGKSNPLIASLAEYMNKRKKLVEQRKGLDVSDGADINRSSDLSSLAIDKENIVNDIIKKNPEFQQFYNYYLSQDQLLPIVVEK